MQDTYFRVKDKAGLLAPKVGVTLGEEIGPEGTPAVVIRGISYTFNPDANLRSALYEK